MFTRNESVMMRRSARLLRSAILLWCLGPTVSLAAEFPTRGLLPKHETGAAQFLNEYPEYDGRGVVVAIFDTGVDPSAAGLQTTTDGKPKIVDMIDGSGSGDVDTSAVRQITAGCIEGLSGRKLKVPASWSEKNPAGCYRVGIKRAFELFPARLLTRLKQARRKRWDARQRVLITRLQRQIYAFDQQHPQPKGKLRQTRDDLRTRLDMLHAAQQEFSDPGPLYDCVVFQDGEVWRAAIDTDEDGDLADEKLLSNYRLQREYATLGSEALLSFAVNIYEEGNLLSIVTDCGSHGTHVAGIVAAHYPDQPELNGIAPGAQIVSVKIGDRRLGSSGTGTGEVRGLVAVLRNQCDLINMSYGGTTTDPNRGRLIDYFSEIVNKHRVIFVASAGNNGPGLSTVASPGGTTSALLGVGAYVSPEMMAAEYALRQLLAEMPYTWSSRGPTYDGDWGVNICAPGGAIATMPKWSLMPQALKNGTSMSAPNACGNIALLLSGLKREQLAYSPHSVRRAIENTARAIGNSDVFAHGRGLIQTDKAFEYLEQHAQAEGELLRFEVDLPQLNNHRGIYLRDPYEARRRLETQVRVRPHWHENADNEQKVAFQLRVRLQSTAAWVQAPQHLILAHGGRTFDVEVDPTGLAAGVHYAEVRGYDATDASRGPLFRLPITVVRPERLDEGQWVWRTELGLSPGSLQRHFIAVPPAATWADLTVRGPNIETSRRLVMHAIQRLPKAAYSDNEFFDLIRVRPTIDTVRSFKVVGGQTLELCLGQNWSSLGEGQFAFELSFHGVVPSDPDLQFDGSRLSGRVDISTPLRAELIEPAASLDRLRQSIRPQKALMRPLSVERDCLPEGLQFYESILHYEFALDAETQITPWSTLDLHDESWFEFTSAIWQIFDAQKQLQASGGWDNPVTLGKGKYLLRFHFRHERAAALKKLEQLPLLLDHKLKQPIKLGLYGDPDDLTAGRSKLGARPLACGERTTLYIALPTALPETARPGNVLRGKITFGKADGNLTGSGRRPDGFPIQVVVPPRPQPKPQSAGDEQTEKSLDEKLRDTRFKHLTYLRKQQLRDEFDQLSEKLLEQPDDQFQLEVLLERVRFLDDQDRQPRLPEIVSACDRLLGAIDQDRLAEHYGTRLDPHDEAAADRRKQMDRRKEILVDAIYRKTRALAFMDLPAKYTASDEPPAKQFPAEREARDKLFEESFAQLRKWVDVLEPEYVLVHVRRERRHDRMGEALKALNTHITRSPPSQLLFKKRSEIYDELGWDLWRDYERQWMLLRGPAAYPPF